MKMILLEDDQFQSEVIATAIEKAFPGAQVSRIGTEHEFRSRLDEIVSSKPVAAILDVMVTWQRPAPIIYKRPPEVEKERHFRAGVRCRQLLRDKDPALPVILYSVLEQMDLGPIADEPGAVCYMQKQGDVGPLIHQIRRVKREPRLPSSSVPSPPPLSS